MGSLHLMCSLGEREDGSGQMMVNPDLLPHLLVGGAAGQGKSSLLNNIVLELMEGYSPEVVRFYLFDPSQVEFLMFNDMPHLDRPVITDSKMFMLELERLETEIERRLSMFAKAKCRCLFDFNMRTNPASDGFPRSLPYIIVVADDVSELMCDNGERVTSCIRRLTARARAAGIHLIFSVRNMDQVTMRGLSVNMFPARVTFQTWSGPDSVAVIGTEDAMLLKNPGDFIYRRGVDKTIRGRSILVSCQKSLEKLNRLKEKYVPKSTQTEGVRFWQ